MKDDNINNDDSSYEADFNYLNLSDDEDENIIDFSDGIEWSEYALKTIFALNKEYRRLLKRRITIPVDKSETHRKASSDAFSFLNENYELELDASLYRYFTAMHELRIAYFINQITQKRVIISSFVKFVKEMAHPVVSSVGKPEISSYFDLIREASSVYEVRPSIDNEKQFNWIKEFEPLSSHMFTFGEIMDIEKEVIKKLLNKEFSRKELNAILSEIEAEILSKLIAEHKIIAIIKENDKIFFTDDKKLPNNKVVNTSISLLISPERKEKVI